MFNKNKSILGNFDFAFYHWKQTENPRNKWVVVENFAFAHYMIKLNGQKTLYEIAVDDHMKRKGIAKTILSHIGSPISLKTDADNLESNSFYRSLGFICLGQKFTSSGKKVNIYEKY